MRVAAADQRAERAESLPVAAADQRAERAERAESLPVAVAVPLPAALAELPQGVAADRRRAERAE